MRSRPVARFTRAVVVIGIVVGVAGCIHQVFTTEAKRLPRPTSGAYFVNTPIKAHLLNGNTVLFHGGATVDNTSVTGTGIEYALLDAMTTTSRARVPLDSVVGIETFEAKRLHMQSAVLSIAATGAAAFGTGLLLIAIFGSCPTVYADTGAGLALQAEGFSYAIAPLLEHRDVDPLNVRPDANGIIRLELRNEALETHFINHIELLAVRRAPGTIAVPDQSGRLLSVGDVRPLVAAIDRAGRDVRATLASSDGVVFATDSATTNAARAGDLDDWLDLEANDLPPGDSLAVVLRLRNSLLNTVLLYDGILGGRDAPEFLATGMQHIGAALDLSRWYTRTMGMHLTMDGVPLPSGARGHARLGDVGPIAFRDVAVILPRPSRNARNVRVRLRFVADDWRIDRAAIGGTLSRPTQSTIRLARVIAPTPARGGPPAADTAALSAMGDADERYLETHPGQRMTLEFDTCSTRFRGYPLDSLRSLGMTAPRCDARGDSTTTYLIAWQGWYREWIRGSWLAKPTRTTAWIPGDSAVSTALARWRQTRDTMERAFYSSRIPVR